VLQAVLAGIEPQAMSSSLMTNTNSAKASLPVQAIWGRCWFTGQHGLAEWTHWNDCEIAKVFQPGGASGSLFRSEKGPGQKVSTDRGADIGARELCALAQARDQARGPGRPRKTCR